jgi:apolipoprotein N-acyltransferase
MTSGLTLALSFPRFDLSGLAWVALVPLVVLALSAPPRAALGWGWLVGLVFYLVLLRWLNFTFRVYSALPGPLVYLPTFTLAGYCGLYVGAFAAAVAWIARSRSVGLALATAPFLWVATEWVRGHLMGGFPWGLLGYSQYLVLPVIQVAELGGIYAVSFLVAGVNVALGGALWQPWRRALAGLAIAAGLLAATLAFGSWRLHSSPSPETVRVAIMQPSIEQPLKFEPSHAASTLAVYADLTRRAGAGGPELIVWPETAVPTVLRRDPPVLGALSELAAGLRSPLLVGSIDVEGLPARARNTAFLLTDRGIIGRYDKIQLVPFGEYVPLSGVLGFVRGWAEFIADLEPGSVPVVFSGPPAPFGVVICYEGIFPELVRGFVRGGARLMINMTNDAWFGRTSGPAQHLAMYPFRAVEHRTAVVRAANTGVSAFIAPSGAIVRRLELFERGTLTEPVPLRTGATFYTRFGDWLAWVAVVVSGGSLTAAWVRPRRQVPHHPRRGRRTAQERA